MQKIKTTIRICLYIWSIFFSNILIAQDTDADLDKNCSQYSSLYGYPDYDGVTPNTATMCIPITDRANSDIAGEPFSTNPLFSNYNPYKNSSYFGRNGGLYPNSNLRLSTYLSDGQNASDVLKGEDTIIFVGIGASTPTAVFKAFQDITGSTVSFGSTCHMEIVVTGHTKQNLDDYLDNLGSGVSDIDGDTYITSWDFVMKDVAVNLGYTGTDEEEIRKKCRQVDVMWVMNSHKEADEDDYPEIPIEDGQFSTDEEAYTYDVFNNAVDVITADYRTYLKDLIGFDAATYPHFPNVKMIYLSDLPYEGYVDVIGTDSHPILDPPYDHWNGWVVKEIIAEYIGEGEDNFWDGVDAMSPLPYVTWGPYFWKRGNFKHDFDELVSPYHSYYDDAPDDLNGEDYLWECHHYDGECETNDIEMCPLNPMNVNKNECTDAFFSSLYGCDGSEDDGFHLSKLGIANGKDHAGEWMWQYFNYIDADIENIITDKEDGVSDWFAERINECAPLRSVQQTECNGELVKVYPIPSPSLITFQLNFFPDDNEYRIIIIDINGKIVGEISKIETDIVSFKFNLPNGLYQYKLLRDVNEIESGKIMIVN